MTHLCFLLAITVTNHWKKGFPRLLGTLLRRLKILLLSLFTVGIKDRCAALHSYTVNRVILVYRNIYAFRNRLLTSRYHNGNRFKKAVAEQGFFT